MDDMAFFLSPRQKGVGGLMLADSGCLFWFQGCGGLGVWYRGRGLSGLIGFVTSFSA